MVITPWLSQGFINHVVTGYSLHKDGKLEKSHGGVTLWAMNIPLLKHHYSWLLGGVSMVPKHYPLWSFLLHLLYIIIIYYYYYEIILLLSLMILLLPPMGSFFLEHSPEISEASWLQICRVHLSDVTVTGCSSSRCRHAISLLLYSTWVKQHPFTSYFYVPRVLGFWPVHRYPPVNIPKTMENCPFSSMIYM